MSLPIRFVFNTNKTHVPGQDPPVPTHALVGLKYINELSKCDLEIKCVSSMGMSYGILDDPDWETAAPYFNKSVQFPENNFINVVCTFGGAIFERWLTKGVYNIAITVAWPRLPKADEIEILKKYDYICVPNQSDLHAFEKIGLSAYITPIKDKYLYNFFANYVFRNEKKFV